MELSSDLDASGIIRSTLVHVVPVGIVSPNRADHSSANGHKVSRNA